jgi:hypothetical protein
MERMRGRGGVYGGGCFLISGQQIERQKKITKINTTKALDGHRSIFCHATTNQKHVGVTEGGWDRPRDRARMLGERDGKLRATKTTTTSTARTATSPMMTTNTPLALTVSAIGPKTQQSTISWWQQ